MRGLSGSKPFSPLSHNEFHIGTADCFRLWRYIRRNRYMANLKNISRVIRLLLALVGLSAVSSAAPVTVTKTFSHSGVTATISVTFNDGTNTMSWTWSRTHGGSPHVDGIVYFGNRAAGSSGSYSYNVDTNHTSPLSGSGSSSWTVGREAFISARVLDGSTVLGFDDYVGIPIPAPPEKKVTVAFRNTTGLVVKYKLMGGTPPAQIGSTITLQPGQALIQSIDVPVGTDASTLAVVSMVDDIQYTEDGWFVVPGAVKEQTVKDDFTATDLVPTGDPPGTPIDAPVPSELPNTPIPSPTSGGGLWRPDVPATDADLLTRKAYREGVDKLSSNLNEINKTLDEIKDAIPEGTSEDGTVADATAQANTDKSTALSAANSNVGASATSNVFVTAAPTPGTRALGILSPGVPANSENLFSAKTSLTGLPEINASLSGTLPWWSQWAQITRELILWGLVITFIYACWGKIDELAAALNSVAPTAAAPSSLSVFVPGAAQAVGVTKAIAILALTTGLWGIMIGFMNTGLTGASFTVSGIFNSSGGNVSAIPSAMQKGYDLAAQWVPLAAMVQLAGSYLVFRISGSGAFMFSAAVIRFLSY